MSKNLQIDLLPFRSDELQGTYTSYKMNIYVNGSSYQALISLYEANRMVENGLVSQVKGQSHNSKGEIVNFEYDDNLDSAGVQFTSQVFKITE